MDGCQLLPQGWPQCGTLHPPDPQNAANLPMVAKPLYGVVSDAFYIQGQHRLPYIALGGKCLGSVCLSSIYVLLVSMKKYMDAALETRGKAKL